jgi:hypothetical protein
MATNPDLILKFKHLIINNNNVNGRWMCDEEVIRYLRDDEGLPTSLTVANLNRMVTSNFIMVTDCHEINDEDNNLLVTIYRIKKQIVLDKVKSKQFYYVQLPHMDHPKKLYIIYFYVV